ncbi:BppU family phage baseplate upper protein [Bacillus luti]|uniref:BppU family phage baseplate upper protein n=1 Tax=Bacillus luti TaxID=2026191 RepID=UPI00289AFFF7|nr:BppU family phage baseplate upper protein [Bacillus luti]
MANSIFKTYEVTVDTMKDSSVPQNMRYSQNDLKSAKILINVNHDGNEEDFSEAIAVRVSFEKSDKKIVYQDCQPINVMKGKYQVLLTTQTLTSVGIVTAHIHIYFPNDKKVETGSFTFEVVESKMSDEVIESTDSFTVIQKAIEVGEKFQNVDFAPIIAAGALAQGALPKAGGTMTGNIDMDIAVGSKSKGVRWKDATSTLFGIESSTTGELILYDYKSAARIWQYDPVAKRFTVLADSNLLKNTGGVMSGHLNFEKDKGLYFKNADTGAATTLYSDANGMILRDLINGTNIWQYNYASKTFDISTGVSTNVYKKTDLYPNASQPNGYAFQLANGTDLDTIIDTGIYAGGVLTNAPAGRTDWGYITVKRSSANVSIQTWQNLQDTNRKQYTRRRNGGVWGAWVEDITADGGTMTGNLDVPRVNTTNAIPLLFNGVSSSTVSWKTSVLGEGLVFTPSKTTGVTDWDDTKKVTISPKGEVTAQAFKTPKDGRATITVTADAELIGPNGVVADRRGNTVTLRAPIRRKAGSTGAVVFTMPVDMRPTMLLTQTVVSNDGTPALMTISATNGEVLLQQIGTSITGKDINILLSYVVD